MHTHTHTYIYIHTVSVLRLIFTRAWWLRYECMFMYVYLDACMCACLMRLLYVNKHFDFNHKKIYYHHTYMPYRPRLRIMPSLQTWLTDSDSESCPHYIHGLVTQNHVRICIQIVHWLVSFMQICSHRSPWKRHESESESSRSSMTLNLTHREVLWFWNS